MIKLFIEYDLILSNQSDFKPGDSCVFQLVFTTQEVYRSFDKGHEVRAVFLDISKAFDKVWHCGIIFKLSQNGISGNLHRLLPSCLSERMQRVVLNVQVSTWANATAGVPQTSIIGSLLFWIYINNLPEGRTFY